MKKSSAGMMALGASLLMATSIATAGKPAGVTGELRGPNVLVDGLAAAQADAGGADIGYGDSVMFDVVVDGKLNLNRERVYATTVCVNFADDVVYQASDWGDSVQFDLWDLAGQGLQWNGESADCIAMLILRTDGGRKGDSITVLDQVAFAVAPAS